MSGDMFLKIEGKDLKGESNDSVHEEEIDVLAWSWGATQSGSMHTGTGGGSGKVSVQDLSVTKNVDKATPGLLLSMAKGEHFEKAALTIRKAGSKGPVEYLIIRMENVLITSYSTGGSGGNDIVTENMTLNFSNVVLQYSPQDDKGNKAGDLKFGWDIRKNEEKPT